MIIITNSRAELKKKSASETERERRGGVLCAHDEEDKWTVRLKRTKNVPSQLGSNHDFLVPEVDDFFPEEGLLSPSFLPPGEPTSLAAVADDSLLALVNWVNGVLDRMRGGVFGSGGFSSSAFIRFHNSSRSFSFFFSLKQVIKWVILYSEDGALVTYEFDDF